MSTKGTYADPELMFKLASYRMPFGKYASQRLIDLPEPYVVWFANQGFPDGELGKMLSMVHEIKINGMEHFFDEMRNKFQNHDAGALTAN